MEHLKKLLDGLAFIQDKYDTLAEKTGEHFNVFEILGVTTNELSHSSILTNLLDTNGKHGQKDAFLKLFINLLQTRFEGLYFEQFITEFDTKKAKAVKEMFIGGVNLDKEEGGRVDIVITSGKNNIVIENKINAIDQPSQLIRYNNHFPNQPILYLTLDGKAPSENAKGKLKNDKDFITVSYQYDIINWLGECVKITENKPFIKETINQYIILLQNLTNQSNSTKMSEELRSLITEDNVELIPKINNELDKIRNEISEEIANCIDVLPIDLGNNTSIEVSSEQDEDGFFIGYEYYINKENKSTDAKAKEFFEIIKKQNFIKIDCSNHFFAFYYPLDFKKGKTIQSLGDKKLIEMYRNPQVLKDYIQSIKNQEKTIRDLFL